MMPRAHNDPRAAFEACGRSYVEFALTHAAYFRVMFRPELTGKANRDDIDRASDKSFAVLLGVVARCQANGLATALDAEALALTGWSAAHGLAALCLDGPLSSKGDPRALAATVGATLGALLTEAPKLPARAKSAARSQ